MKKRKPKALRKLVDNMVICPNCERLVFPVPAASKRKIGCCPMRKRGRTVR
jgi:hypothetical protein